MISAISGISAFSGEVGSGQWAVEVGEWSGHTDWQHWAHWAHASLSQDAGDTSRMSIRPPTHRLPTGDDAPR